MPLTSIDVLYAWMYGSWKSVVTLEVVQPPSFDLNAPSSTDPAGRNRNATAYAKNGTVGSQTREKRLRPDETSGRSASDTAFVAMVQDPTLLGHSLAIRAFAF